MTWTTPNELKAQLTRLWSRGELLRDVVTQNQRFPLRLTLKCPSSTDITDNFIMVRNWAAALSATDFVRIEWQEIRHRVQGAQKIPASVWIDTIEDALHILNKRKDWDRFLMQVSSTRLANPALLPWLAKRPLQGLELTSDWPNMLAVVNWISRNPRPNIYLRQVDLAGVHSKFIESNRGVLTELLDMVLPAQAVDLNKTGVSQFASRYGFVEKPQRIRFRVLDPTLNVFAQSICPDVSLDAESFSAITIAVKHVFITENEINFLAFPLVRNAIVIFGAGYGWDAIARAKWLSKCSIHYWGDIDTHGFAILNQLRGHFADVDSFLMDRTTLDAHEAMWGREDKPTAANLVCLTAPEQELYDVLRDNRIRAGLRLEQEYIGFEWLKSRIDQLSNS